MFLEFFETHSLNGCSSYVKASTYKCIVRPSMEYASSAWFLHTAGDRNCLDAVRNRAARWACGSRWCKNKKQWSK